MAKPKAPRADIGRRLVELMADSTDLKTQQALSKRSGVGQTTIGRIMRGEVNPSIDVLDRLASALGSSVGYLTTGKLRVGEFEAPPYRASQDGRPDPYIVRVTAKALRIFLARRKVTFDLERPEHADLFSEALGYAAKMMGTPEWEMEFGATVVDLVSARERQGVVDAGERGREQVGGMPGSSSRKAGAGG